MLLVGICAWISLCLLIAGWIPFTNEAISTVWMISGLMGLVSAVGLAETIKSDMRTQEVILQQYMLAAMTDGLTGLANRQALDRKLGAALQDAQSSRREMCLIMIDIDHFKLFNDEWGHQAGDAVLREISRQMESFFRPHGSVARYGGEEFAVVLPDCRLADAEKLAEEFRLHAKHTTCAFRDKTFHITISAGVTTCSSDDTIDSILRRADLALYTAKKMGRDCIWLADIKFGNTSNLEQIAALVSPAPNLSEQTATA
ncbi:GGDEF domain-containing protein [Planctomicrobium sp. SH664]|uniref:GGDEF domain-containing protein n=1 Tax=Planctomicrobium sp. SH664 TaxID=3448125 RepID=UPI003F5C636B